MRMPRNLSGEVPHGLMPIERAECSQDGEVMADAMAVYQDGQPVGVRLVCPFCKSLVGVREFKAGKDTVIR